MLIINNIEMAGKTHRVRDFTVHLFRLLFGLALLSPALSAPPTYRYMTLSK